MLDAILSAIGLDRFTGAVALILGAIVALAGGAWRIARNAVAADRAKRAAAAAKADTNRTRLDDEIQQDPDLAARARRIGIVRPDR